ncbi:MAG: cadherin domain-containing protein, partial [Planctomycetaceae bacterium]|nr:cadherin domain-containing protein [Planctomycetaceae bacterium]
GNFIGTNAALSTGLGNSYQGIGITGSGSTDNLIGGTTSGDGNVIAHNTFDGIGISSGTGNSILGNRIHSNGAANDDIAIDLLDNGVTANDTAGTPPDQDTGANDLQNFPVLFTAAVNGTDLQITGQLPTDGLTTQYRIEFFNNPLGTEDPSGHGEARVYLGAVTVTTNGSGVANISTTLNGVSVAVGDRISATATEILNPAQVGVNDLLAYGSTSEMSLNLPATPANTSPTITSNGGLASISLNVAENTTAVTDVNATDPEAPPQTLTYSIIGGADQLLFDIDANTGVLTFKTAPDFESPTDVGTNNVYNVTVQVSDGAGGTDTQAIAVTVTNQAISSISYTGTGTVVAGTPYTLNLSANEDATSWTINWGDGTIETIAGNPSSATHVYDAQAGGLTFNVTAAATDADGTIYTNRLYVPSWAGTDLVHIYQGNDALFSGTMAPLSDGLDDHIEVIQGPNGNLFVSSEISDSVLEYTTNGTLIGTFVAAGSGGLNGSAGMAFGPNGDLYVASYVNSQVLRFDGTTGDFVEVVVSSGTGGLDSPLGLNFGPDGQLYVASRGGNKILRFDPETGSLDTGFDGSVGGMTEDFTFGPDGHIYAVDASNARIVQLDATDGTLLSVFVASGAGGLGYPAGIAFGPDGNLYVGDQASHAIRMYDGSTGAYLGDHVTSGSGGLVKPAYFVFEANQQVAVISNTGPSQVLPVAQTTPEDTTITFSTANGNAITVDDGTAATDTRLQVFLSVDGFNGTLTLSQTTNLSFPGGANGTSSMVIWGTEADINAALEGMVFTPNLHYNGSANITVETKLAADLQGLYEFENAGNVGQDTSVGVLQTGTKFGSAAVVVDGTRGNVLNLDGSGDYIEIPSPGFGDPDQVTMAAWVNVDASEAGWPRIMEMNSVASITYESSAKKLYGWGYDGTDWYAHAYVIDLNAEGWTHVTFSWTESTLTGQLYVNGVAVTPDETWTLNAPGGVADGSTYIGAHPSGSDNLNGMVDDARVYTRIVSAAEIAAIAGDAHTATGTIPVTVTAVNNGPALLNFAGTPTFTEGGAAVTLDSDLNAVDLELDALNGGAGNYSGASTTIVRNGGANADDVFAFIDGNGITRSGSTLLKSGQVIATFDTTTTPGQLVITFTDANGQIPTSVNVDNILRQVTYANSSDAPPASVTLDWTFNDGNTTNSQGSGGALLATGSKTVNITATNDAPQINASSPLNSIAEDDV